MSDITVNATAGATVGRQQPRRAPSPSWLLQGLRAGLLLTPRVGPAQPTPWQTLLLLLLVAAIHLGVGRLEVDGPAHFNSRAYFAAWWTTGLLLLLVWAAQWGVPPREGGPRGVASWFTLDLGATLPALLVAQALYLLSIRGVLPDSVSASPVFQWALFLGLWGWMVAVALRLSWHFGVGRQRLAALAVGLVGLFTLQTWQNPGSAWYADESESAADDTPRLVLSQETFEQQQQVWAQSVEALAPQRPGVVDVYGLVFAPYAHEDVFLRETTMVKGVLGERFDAEGRVLHLANHATTAAALPWATPLNLQRAVQALAARMDRDEDVLVVYLTSHGASNFRLSAAHHPLSVDDLTPAELRRALDDAGIRHRVLAVSACYSGGWVAPLASDTTLVMTAADPEHTSYGCGRKSELTFFGRALFDEQLRKTHSFEAAFAAAVPLIKQREIDAGKDDGFSNPQISVGTGIRPVLQALEQRLAAARKD